MALNLTRICCMVIIPVWSLMEQHPTLEAGLEEIERGKENTCGYSG